MINLKYLVVGTGRCGSVFMARLLTSLNIPCSHEAIFNYQGLNYAKEVLNGNYPLKNSHCSTYDILNLKKIDKWLHSNVIAESSYMAAPFLKDDILKNTKIIHIVRNPLKVISSHVKDINFFEPHKKHNLWLDYVLSEVPELNSIENTIEKACYFYTHWNNMIEANIVNHINIRHNTENCCTPELLDFLEVKNPINEFKNNQINSWKKRTEDLTLNDIPDGSIRNDFIAIGEKYGYL